MEFRLPELGEGVYEAELVSWLVKPGEAVRRGQNLMEVLTDKATMEVPAPFAGTITALQAEPGKQIKVGDVVLTYSQPADAGSPGQGDGKTAAAGKNNVSAGREKPAHREARPNAAPPPNTLSQEVVKAAPSVRYLARQLGIDLATVPGSGPGGRILMEDLSGYVKPANDNREPNRPQAARPSRAEAVPAEALGKPGTRIKLQGLRRMTAERMVRAKKAIPHYSYVDECDVTEMVRLREGLRESFAREGIKLTYMAFFVKAVAVALKEVPIVNASLDEEAGEIVFHDHYHIGIATSTPAGLIVPVLRDADRKGLPEVAREIERLSADARAGRSRLEDLRGGTFTITSVGGIGGLFFAPVINHPEVGILGVGKVVRRPVYDEHGNVRPAELVYLSSSFDHRVVDGAVGATFGNAIIRQLQNPAALLLPEKLIP